MPKLKIVILTSMVFAGVAASWCIQHKMQADSRERGILLQQQEKQVVELAAEQQRLSNAVVQSASPPREDHKIELTKLRGEVEALRKQTNELGEKLKERQLRPSQAAITQPHPPEYYEQLHRMEGAKSADAMYLALAVIDYADKHQGQTPANLDELSPYLARRKLAISGTNQFDLVYQGSLKDLEGIPAGEVAVVRERESWLAPDGKMARVYGMMGGVGQSVTSDDNFQSWEAEHVIGTIGGPR